ncbi:hypothetical protein BG003_001992 [Podila horticola]|nr:hypothetical protein BG003_001992 [Podila horticola]
MTSRSMDCHGLVPTAIRFRALSWTTKKSAGQKETPSTAVVPIPVKQPSVLVDLLSQLKNPSVLILVIQYGCSFGLELAVGNMIGEFFHSHFGLSQTTSGILGSIFGLMNIFSRASGGMLADYINSLVGEGTQGRMLVHFFVFLFEGAFIIGFSFAMDTELFDRGLVIVPFANPSSMGAVYGLVGASGSIGSIVFNYIFKIYGTSYVDAFRDIGYMALSAAMHTLLLKRQDRRLLGLVFKKLYP